MAANVVHHRNAGFLNEAGLIMDPILVSLRKPASALWAGGWDNCGL